jgi:hypothetical protein
LLLIHPPVAKPAEPPAGLARLASALRHRNIPCRVWDANLEGLLDLVSRAAACPHACADTWTRRAANRIEENLAAVRSIETFFRPERYKQAVLDINRLLHAAAAKDGCRVTLSNFTHPRLTPLRSRDLLEAAETFEKNPFYPFFKGRLADWIENVRPTAVGFSVNFLSQAVCAFAMAGFTRKAWPGLRIVLGGGLVTSWLHIQGLKNPFFPLVDELVAGPGEAALISAEEGLESPEREVGMDFTDFDMDAYLSPLPVLPYPASRGCYWRKCRFCPETYEKTPYQPFDKEAVAVDAAEQAGKTGAGLIHFVDSALAPAFLKTIVRRPPGASWYGFVRATPHLADPDFARRLKQSGCVMLKLGIESGDQDVLDSLEKGVRLETISRALEVVKAAGISVYAYLLFGTPAETHESARRTLSFIKGHAGQIDFLNLAIFNLPAGSLDRRGLESADFSPADLSLYSDFVHPRGWHRTRVRRFLEKEFKQAAPVRAMLRRDPPFFTSNHAPFLGSPNAFH